LTAREDRVAALRPPRPASVEAAAAILVVGSAMDAVLSLSGLLVATGEARGLFAISVSISLGLVLLGMLVRSGRAWLAAVNIVAVSAFLELRSVTALGVTAAVLDMVVVGLLLRSRWWFRWAPPDEGDDEAVPGPAAPPRLRSGGA
jgi:hypothetical protein